MFSSRFAVAKGGLFVSTGPYLFKVGRYRTEAIIYCLLPAEIMLVVVACNRT